MSVLVIVGNGFDLHHNMKTEYYNYRQFLLDNDMKSVVEIFENGIIDENDIKYLWSNVESNISMLNYESAYVYLKSYRDDDWSDSANHDFQYEVKKMTNYWPTLKDCLKDWVMSIGYTSPNCGLIINRDLNAAINLKNYSF